MNDSSHYQVSIKWGNPADGEKPDGVISRWYGNQHCYHTARVFRRVTTNWMFPASVVGIVWLPVLWIVNSLNTLLMLWMSGFLSFWHCISWCLHMQCGKGAYPTPTPPPRPLKCCPELIISSWLSSVPYFVDCVIGLLYLILLYWYKSVICNAPISSSHFWCVI